MTARILGVILISASSLACATVQAQSAAEPKSLDVYWQDFLNKTFMRYDTLWEPPLAAGLSVAWSDFVIPAAGFGPGARGYAHHYVVALGDNVNGKFMRQFVFAAAAGHEDCYDPSADDGLGKRIGLALLHTVYRRPDPSDWTLNVKTLNWSGVPASFVQAALSNAYQPTPQQTWSSTFERVGISTGGYAVSDVWKAITNPLQSNHPKLYSVVRP